MWYKNQIISILNRSNEAVEHALVGVYGLKADNPTLGFNEKDELFLGNLAERVINNPLNKPLGKRLSKKQIEIVRYSIKKYWQQIMYITAQAEAELEEEVG